MLQVAPLMRWTEGDVWVLDTPVREGTHSFKAYLRRADGAYIAEKGLDRVLTIPSDASKGVDGVVNIQVDAQLPW